MEITVENEANLVPAGTTTECPLIAALVAVHAELEIAGKNRENAFGKYKYSDLEEIVTTSRKLLSKNGLVVTHELIVGPENTQLVETKLSHVSGKFMKSTMRVITKGSTIHDFGAGITYAKKYNYCALVGVVSRGEDDDGEGNMDRNSSPAGQKKSNAAKQNNDVVIPGPKFIDAGQLHALSLAIQGMDDIKKQILNRFKVVELKYVPADKFDDIHEWVLSVKAKRNEGII